MRNNNSFFWSATIKGCAIVMSLSASTMLIQGCADMGSISGLNIGSMVSSASGGSLNLGFSIPGAPSDEVERWIFYAKATSLMSDELLERQNVVNTELAKALDYKGDVKDAEALASFTKNVDTSELTPDQVHQIEKLQPAYFGLGEVTVVTGQALYNLVDTATPTANTARSDLKYVGLLPELPSLGSNLKNTWDNVGPVFDGFISVRDSYNMLSKAVGVAELSPAAKKKAKQEEVPSSAGAGVEFG